MNTMRRLDPNSWNLDIDRWLNQRLPRNRTGRLPPLLARFLGHGPRKPVGNVLLAWWAFVGAFIGIVILEGIFMIPEIQKHGVPVVVASFGAVAILEFNFIESPLAQPRNALLGHFLATLVGVGVTKLFRLNSDFEQLRWLVGAMACGLASAAMVFAKATYPPAGATALLAAVDPAICDLGWYLLPIVLLSAMLTLVVSLFVNNIQRRYPLYWWTPEDIGEEGTKDIEKLGSEGGSSHYGPSTSGDAECKACIKISGEGITIPPGMSLAREEHIILEVLRHRLRDHPGE